jgi:hypothetical protein
VPISKIINHIFIVIPISFSGASAEQFSDGYPNAVGLIGFRLAIATAAGTRLATACALYREIVEITKAALARYKADISLGGWPGICDAVAFWPRIVRIQH